jgi:sigma-B regulation protein RsbU (phosphoserine phosphatase)
MAYLPKKLDFLHYNHDNPFTEPNGYLEKYNAYRMVTYSPLTLNQNLNVAAFSEPSRVVSGDFYIIYQKDHDRVGVIIADACGKGLGAAKLILHIKSLLKLEMENGHTIEQVLQNLNDSLDDAMQNGKFITLFFGIINTRSRELLYANAGHDLPIILHQDSSYEYLNSTGPGLGILRGANFDIEKRFLNPNDLLFFYTDGVTDVFNDFSEIYGQQRLLDCLSKHRWYPPESIIDSLLIDVEQFSASDTILDDRTMVVMKFQ